MKKNYLLLLFIAVTAIAQPKKYQSLLWEISGNGLAKKSYLYGSMHVSEKVSYHLSDAFFQHLLAADYVANESDPSTWIALYDVFGNGAYSYLFDQKAFYAKFYQQPVKREDLYPLFVSNTNVMNNLLFRTNENQKDYQEDTYLDMFIYQTGKKYKKKVVGLEDAKASMISIMNAETADFLPKEANMQAIVKLLKEKSFNQALLDYYRDKNLDMLDSLYTLATPVNYLKALIHDRNLVMSKSIDSIVRKGSLFAAIGAAHLPGKNGVIELLRSKGYVITPVVDAYTQKGRNAKKQIDEYFIKPQFEMRATTDGMIRLPMHTQPIFSNDNIGTPDLANGGIVNLKRIPLRNYLRKDQDGFNAQSLDSLFYENIPGDILEKKSSADDNYSWFDIRNRTKTGNAQRYKYYITPLEVICVSMSGNGDYVRQYENDIFPNIRLKKYTSGWETITPAKGGFSILAPAYYSLYGNREAANPSNIELTAWDEAEKAYYFLTERTVDDNNTLENTEFELKRIQDEFYNQIDANTSAREVARSSDSYESEAAIGKKTICLKTVVNGQKYYLLGTVNATSENSRKFFSSFALKGFTYDSPMRTFIDSTAGFSVDIPEKENEKLFWKIKTPEPYKGNLHNQKTNLFESRQREFVFYSPSGKTVNLDAWTSHRYDYVNRDSLLVNLKKNIISDFAEREAQDAYENFEELQIDGSIEYASAGMQGASARPSSIWEKFFADNSGSKKRNVSLTNEKESYDPANQLYRLEVTAERENSRQAIKYNVFMKDGYIWRMRALVEKGYKGDDRFIESVADSFAPNAKAPEQSLFSKKIDVFLQDAKSEDDTIRYSALESIGVIEFTDDDLPKLGEFLNSFDFRPEETSALSAILEKLGRLDNPQVIPFLENSYRKQGANTALQLAVIRALAKQKSKPAYKKIMELLEYDLPLSDSEYEISGLFYLFGQDPENSKALFPDIFQFYGVKEYHEPIVRFTTQLFRDKHVNPKKGSSYKKLLLTDAKLEYKRVAGWKSKTMGNEFSTSDYYGVSPVETLTNYCNLLYPFRSDKSIKQWLEKTSRLDIAEVTFELARLELEYGNTPPNETLEQLLTDPKTRFSAYRLLADRKNQAPKWSDDDIALAAITGFTNVDAKSSDISIVEKRVVPLGDESFTVFFFLAEPKEQENPTLNADGSKLAAVAFANDKHGIDIKSWTVTNILPLRDEATIKAESDIILDKLLNGTHLRATFGKNNDKLFPAYLEEEY